VRYHPASVPYQPYSRWMHMPWNGWQEADLRTNGFQAVGYRVALPLILCEFE
jgi:hypothetical protein